jgi:hypothetical protein
MTLRTHRRVSMEYKRMDSAADVGAILGSCSPREWHP